MGKKIRQALVNLALLVLLCSGSFVGWFDQTDTTSVAAATSQK